MYGVFKVELVVWHTTAEVVCVLRTVALSIPYQGNTEDGPQRARIAAAGGQFCVPLLSENHSSRVSTVDVCEGVSCARFFRRNLSTLRVYGTAQV